jgi:hypothetical protein
MGQRKQSEQTDRDQEVVRANRDLAAYFKGRRTEREARAALKIIKAFVRERERIDPKKRPALPGVSTPADPGGTFPRAARPKIQDDVLRSMAGPIDLADDTDTPASNKH